MDRKYFMYLFEVQYLGLRYHGWQKQGGAPSIKTVQGSIERVFKYLIGEGVRFKTMTTSRTDAGVSANGSYFELFSKEAINAQKVLEEFNEIGPDDIRLLSVEEVGPEFNIIQNPKVKEYLYQFTFNESLHPFCAAYMTNFKEPLNIALMQQAAKLFEGEHNFLHYSYKISEDAKVVRSIDLAEVRENDIYSASFFPEKSFLFRVVGKGFLRYQIRKMMGALVRVGAGEWDLEELKRSLVAGYHTDHPIGPVASNGLILNQVKFK